MDKKDAKPRLIRWIMLLQKFDYEIKDRQGSPMNNCLGLRGAMVCWHSELFSEWANVGGWNK